MRAQDCSGPARRDRASTRLAPSRLDLLPKPGLGGLPHALEALGVVRKEGAAVQVTEVKGRIQARGCAPGVGVEDHFVVVPKDAGVEGSPVESDLAALGAGQLTVVAE